MDPNYQPGQPTPSGEPHNPYGFILDTEHQPKRNLGLKPTSNSFRSRLLIMAGGALVIGTLIIVAANLIFGGKDGNTQQLTSLTSQQQEIVRVADLGLIKATDPSTKYFAQTTKLSIHSQQVKLLEYLSSSGVEVPPATLNAKKNANTDTALDSAAASNRFDDVFTETLKANLATYASSLKKDYDAASGEKAKALLAESYNSTANLLK